MNPFDAPMSSGEFITLFLIGVAAFVVWGVVVVVQNRRARRGFKKRRKA